MTIWGWDASHYDWTRGSMDLPAAVRDGISFMTHKVGEGTGNTDDRFDDWYARAENLDLLLGAYYVNHPGDQVKQADRFISLLDARARGWRDRPWILQVDAERFEYMPREPNASEIKTFCDRLVARTDGRCRPIVYAPKWVYGDRLKNLGYPLWASNYGSNPSGSYRALYPGDGSGRWGAYSGQIPAILQYGSRTRIGSQSTCDANAYRGTLDQLTNLVYPGGDDVSKQDVIEAMETPRPFVSEGVGKAARAAGWGDVSDRALTEYTWSGVTALAAQVAAQTKVIETLADTLKAGGGSVDTVAILDGVRDIVADLAEGGAAQVRAEQS